MVLALKTALAASAPPKDHRLKEEKPVCINYINFLNITT